MLNMGNTWFGNSAANDARCANNSGDGNDKGRRNLRKSWKPWSTFGFESIEECPICLEKFENTKLTAGQNWRRSNSNVVVTTPCHHIFHKKCIEDWFARSGVPSHCPNCRREVSKQDLQISRSTAPSIKNVPSAPVKRNSNKKVSQPVQIVARIGVTPQATNARMSTRLTPQPPLGVSDNAQPVLIAATRSAARINRDQQLLVAVVRIQDQPAPQMRVLRMRTDPPQTVRINAEIQPLALSTAIPNAQHNLATRMRAEFHPASPPLNRQNLILDNTVTMPSRILPQRAARSNNPYGTRK